MRYSLVELYGSVKTVCLEQESFQQKLLPEVEKAEALDIFNSQKGYDKVS